MNPASLELIFFWAAVTSCFLREGGTLLKTRLSRLSRQQEFLTKHYFAAFSVDESDANGSNLFYTKQSL